MDQDRGSAAAIAWVQARIRAIIGSDGGRGEKCGRAGGAVSLSRGRSRPLDTRTADWMAGERSGSTERLPRPNTAATRGIAPRLAVSVEPR